MNTKCGVTVLALFIGLLIPFSAAAQSSLTLVYTNTDQTTKHAYDYLRNGLRDAGLSVKINRITADKSLPGDGSPVLILNVAPSGFQPAIQSFLRANKGLKKAVVLNMRSSNDYSVSFLEAAKAPEGVDALTAATAWNRWDHANQAMHETWLKQALNLLGLK